MLFISPPFGNYLTFLPYTIPIKGSYTTQARPGLISQIAATLQYSSLYNGWVNKIGLRNPGIDYGITKYKPKSIMSIAFLNYTDIQYFHDTIPKNANLEINISCPNANVQLPPDIKNFMNEERKWCIVKVSPLISLNKIDELYNMGFRQFHCCNTYPLAIGGLSGPILIPYVEYKIKHLREKYKDCTIIAGGGIQNIETLNHYKKMGADHFSVSSICFNPFRFGLLYFNYLLSKD